MSAVIRFDSLPTSRWSNGLGETVELWRTPIDGDFRVRLSIATVAADTDFSSLPGVQRALMPLQRDGLTLNIDGAIRQLKQYESVQFSGEDMTSSVGVLDRGRDLNLMVRRGNGEPCLDAITFSDGYDFRFRWAVVICLAGEPRFDGSALAFGDTIVMDSDSIRLDGCGTVAVAYLAPPGH
ncbi:MAG: HutD family protein [Nakamurella sp.]